MPVDVLIRPFLKELDFEKALADFLPQHGWEPSVIMNPTEEILIKNWAAIIYNNNRDMNRLGDFPLTDSEMQQIMTQVENLRNPYEVNQFINGGQVMIKRDNPDDKVNYGKEVYLTIFNAREIRAGQSVYQIVRQPGEYLRKDDCRCHSVGVIVSVDAYLFSAVTGRQYKIHPLFHIRKKEWIVCLLRLV